MEREITLTRILDAPITLVYQCWTEPRHVVRWWGPNGFTNPVCEMDVRPGGLWHIVMRGPDGADHTCNFTYREVIPNQRIIFNQDVELNGEHVLEGLTTVTFAAEGAGTRLTVTARAKALVPFAVRMLAGMDAGWSQSLDRFEELAVKGTSRIDREIAATRVFDAPRDLVFQMFTDREHIGHWWGPVGFSLTIHEMDVRPGGSWRFIMHGPDGRDYDNHNVYREVDRPNKLVMEHKSTPPFVFTIVFCEEAPGKTRIWWEMLFETAEIREMTVRQFGAVEGLQQTLNRLGERLSAIR